MGQNNFLKQFSGLINLGPGGSPNFSVGRFRFGFFTNISVFGSVSVKKTVNLKRFIQRSFNNQKLFFSLMSFSAFSPSSDDRYFEMTFDDIDPFYNELGHQLVDLLLFVTIAIVFIHTHKGGNFWCFISEWSSSISYVNKPKPAQFLFSVGSVWFYKSRFGFRFGAVNRRALNQPHQIDLYLFWHPEFLLLMQLFKFQKQI